MAAATIATDDDGKTQDKEDEDGESDADDMDEEDEEADVRVTQSWGSGTDLEAVPPCDPDTDPIPSFAAAHQALAEQWQRQAHSPVTPFVGRPDSTPSGSRAPEPGFRELEWRDQRKPHRICKCESQGSCMCDLAPTVLIVESVPPRWAGTTGSTEAAGHTVFVVRTCGWVRQGGGATWVNWVAARRYREFVALHAGLEKLAFRGRALPKLPTRHGLQAMFLFQDTKFTETRRCCLERYLNDLLASPELSSRREVRLFLGWAESRRSRVSRGQVAH